MNTNKNKIEDELLKRLIKAKAWSDTSQILNKDGYPKKIYTKWQEQGIALLRKLPDAKKNVKNFIRLQRYYNYSWTGDLGNYQTRSMLIESSLLEIVSFLENLLKNT